MQSNTPIILGAIIVLVSNLLAAVNVKVVDLIVADMAFLVFFKR